jgi:hypothetical protein
MQHVSDIAAPVVKALVPSPEVVGILCFGSYAAGTQDQQSDIDLYVVCEPELLCEATRQTILGTIPGVVNLHLGCSTPGWDNQWGPQSDSFWLTGMHFELSYNTKAWLTTVVHKVTAEGALSLPEFTFRPYTMLGLLANAIPLYDPRGVIQELTRLLYPYPAKLKENLLRHFWPILQAELSDLHDCAERGIGNSSFLFYLSRVCGALISILFAINEHYDPATKRPEPALAKLPRLPDNFIARYEQLLEGPFTPTSRHSTVNALTTLTAELAPWIPGANEEKM